MTARNLSTVLPPQPPPRPAGHPPVNVSVAIESDGWATLPGLANAAAARDLCVHAAERAWTEGLAEHRMQPPQSAEISIVLADDALLRDLNSRFRGRDEPTNVLSFPLLEPFAEAIAAADSTTFIESQTGYAPLMAGDIAIALETVLDEAHTQGKPASNHLAHLVVHGVLHLMGHDHEDDIDARRMEALEIVILAAMGIADPYAESANAAV